MSEYKVPKKSLYEYNGEYSYKTWNENLDEDNGVFFELECEKGKRNITFKQAREFISNDYILFDKDENTYMSIKQLDRVFYKKYIGSLKDTLEDPIEDTTLGNLCAYLVDIFESYEYYIEQQKTKKDKEMYFENVRNMFQNYLNKREKILTDINYDIKTLSDSDKNKLVLEVLLVRTVSNMLELCGNKTFNFGTRKFKA